MSQMEYAKYRRAVIVSVFGGLVLAHFMIEHRARAPKLPSVREALGVGPAPGRSPLPRAVPAARPTFTETWWLQAQPAQVAGADAGSSSSADAEASTAASAASPKPAPVDGGSMDAVGAGDAVERTAATTSAVPARPAPSGSLEEPAPSLSDESPLVPEPGYEEGAASTSRSTSITSSSFDEEDLVERHPVPDRGAITQSTFDEEDRFKREEPREDESLLMSIPATPVTSSSFDEEDLVDRHPVPDRGAITHSSFDDEDLVDRHPVVR